MGCNTVPCFRVIFPDPKIHKVYINHDGQVDLYVEMPDIHELKGEIDCKELNGQYCTDFGPFELVFEDVFVPELGIRGLCNGKTEKVYLPVRDKLGINSVLDPRIILSAETGLHGNEVIDIAALIQNFGDNNIYEALRKIILANSRGEILKVGTVVRLIEEPKIDTDESMKKFEFKPFGEKPSESTDALFALAGIGFPVGQIMLASGTSTISTYEWNGSWEITAFTIKGFTADPNREDIKDLSEVPDDNHKYAVIYATIRSSKPVAYEEHVYYPCICASQPTHTYSPEYVFKTVSLNQLSTENIPENPPGAVPPTTVEKNVGGGGVFLED